MRELVQEFKAEFSTRLPFRLQAMRTAFSLSLRWRVSGAGKQTTVKFYARDAQCSTGLLEPLPLAMQAAFLDYDLKVRHLNALVLLYSGQFRHLDGYLASVDGWESLRESYLARAQAHSPTG